MKVSGFTIIRNGEEFDYPYSESLRSLVSIVDELVVNVGKGTDSTLTQIQNWSKLPEFAGKIKIIESVWPLDDPEARRGGKILSEQTNLALRECTGDWCIYLQADEVLHEEDYPKILTAIEQAHRNPQIDGVVFDYVHFYGSFDIEQYSRSSYRREVRCVRRKSGAQSVGDAQSFRKAEGEKLLCLRTTARIFHYGWVRTPNAMKTKTEFMDSLYHGDTGVTTGNNYLYKRIPGLRRFKGSHPAVMIPRITAKNWNWDLQRSPFEWTKRTIKNIFLNAFERWTGCRPFEYRSYRLVSKRPV